MVTGPPPQLGGTSFVGCHWNVVWPPLTPVVVWSAVSIPPRSRSHLYVSTPPGLSVSCAVPTSVTVSSAKKNAFSVGLRMLTMGGPPGGSTTENCTDALPVPPSPSTAVSVSFRLPELRNVDCSEQPRAGNGSVRTLLVQVSEPHGRSEKLSLSQAHPVSA